MTWKDVAKRIARNLGVEIRAFRPSSSHAAQLGMMLSSQGVNLILDVGANVGQFGRELRWHIGYGGRIVSFEPMKAAHQMLQKAAAGDGLWEIAGRSAIGAERGSIQINVAANSVSSSVLPMLGSHVDAAPESRYSSVEVVPLVPLDAVAMDYIREESVAFLKIDTQGYEGEVLRGAPETLKRVVGVQLELSLIPLYVGQKLMPELLQWMTEAGFELWGISPTFADPDSGRMLQVDAIFFRGAAGRR
jgi:FkbM family methyltransferase